MEQFGRRNRQWFSGLLALALCLLILAPAMAAVHNDVITEIKLTTSDLVTPIGNVTDSQQFQLVAKFSLPNNTVHEGDTTVIPVPNELELIKDETFPLKNDGGDTIGTAYVNKGNKTITITYTDYVDTHSDVTGSLHVTVKVDTTVVTTPQTLTLTITMPNGTTTYTLNSFNYIGFGHGDNPNEKLAKWLWFDTNDPTIVHCRIRVNAAGANLSNVTITDIIQAPSVSYVVNSFRVLKGSWALPEGGGYFGFTESENVTAQYPRNFYTTPDGKSAFSIQFGDIHEGYYIKYDIKLAYSPTNGEVINNRIIGKQNQDTFEDALARALYQESGGEANGYNYTIKIRKVAENGETALPGAVFTVTRNSSQAVVGTITTNAQGEGSLSGLLKDYYTITETTPPLGYAPLTQSITVTPADFDKDTGIALGHL